MSEFSRTSSNLQTYLQGLELFAGARPQSIAALAAASRVRKIAKGQVIFFQSDPGDALFIVRSGSVAILLVHFDGREMIINEVSPGDYFGELAVLTQNPRTTSAVALRPVELVVVPGQVFMSCLETDAGLVRRLLEAMAARLSASTERESLLAFLDAQARLAVILLKLDTRWQESGYIVISQAELAARSGLTRQTVAKILGRWRRAGWLLTGRGRVMLLNRGMLHRISQESEQ